MNARVRRDGTAWRVLGALVLLLSFPVVLLSVGCGGGCDDDDTPGERVGEAVEEAGDDIEDALDE